MRSAVFVFCTSEGLMCQMFFVLLVKKNVFCVKLLLMKNDQEMILSD